MSAGRTTIADHLPFLRTRSPLKLLRAGLSLKRRPQPRPNIRARTHELISERAGRLAVYTNVGDFAYSGARPLVLLHGVHTDASAYELNTLFEALREERPIYALDLPGFGCSERGEREYRPEVYVAAITTLLEQASHGALSADVVAVGLTSEYAARMAIVRPDLVHSLTLISPTGFAVKREQDSFERASRQGKPVLPVRLAAKLGLTPLLYRAVATERSLRSFFRRAAGAGSELRDDFVRYCFNAAHQAGADQAGVAYLSGALHPAGNPQSVYTRVHCPTLILYADEAKPHYGSLDTFVKWHEYFDAHKVDDANPSHDASVQQLLPQMHAFWQRVGEREIEEQSGVFQTGANSDDARDVAAVSSY